MIDLSHKNEWQFIDPETGLIFPWYVKSFLDELATWNLEEKKVLEIGGGSSTLWWNKKANKVLTLESNEEYILELLKHGCDVQFFNIHALKNCSKDFDIVIIDGIDRDECVVPALDCLKAGGILIFDNWMQPSVELQTEETQRILTALEHKIFKQDGHEDWQTAIFYKSN